MAMKCLFVLCWQRKEEEEKKKTEITNQQQTQSVFVFLFFTVSFQRLSHWSLLQHVKSPVTSEGRRPPPTRASEPARGGTGPNWACAERVLHQHVHRLGSVSNCSVHPPEVKVMEMKSGVIERTEEDDYLMPIIPSLLTTVYRRILLSSADCQPQVLTLTGQYPNPNVIWHEMNKFRARQETKDQHKGLKVHKREYLKE